MTEQLRVTAIIKAREEKAEELLQMLAHLTEHSLKEPGCLEYGFYRDQSDPMLLLSFELWKDAEAEAAHWQTPHLNRVLARLDELLVAPPVIHKCRKVT